MQERVAVWGLVGLFLGSVAAACFASPDPPPISDNANSLAGAVNKKPGEEETPVSDLATLCDGGAPADGAGCTVSFAKDIAPQFVALGCTGTSCHGGNAKTPAATPPTMDPADAKATYLNLFRTTIGGKRYIDPCTKEAAASTLACNLKEAAAGGCGVRMPQVGALAEPAFVTTVETWAACGSPFN